MTHKLIDLPFGADALEPFMDKETVKIHHGKHHQGYVDKLNLTIEKYPTIKEKPIEELLKNLSSIPNEIKQKVINFGGGVYNHNFFWKTLKKFSPFNPNYEIGKAIIEKWENYENFKKEFTQKALSLFGSGWTWLVLNNNKLEILQTTNQESPISKNMIPLITVDVWEHTYYLRYKNKRPEFIEAFWNIVNWEKINKLYQKAKE